MLQWICYLKSTHLHWDSPEYIPFTNTMRDKVVKGAPASVKSSVVVLVYRPELTMGTVITELGNLNAVGIIGFQNGRGQVVALRQGGYGYFKGQRCQSTDWNHFIGSDLGCWLVDHGFPNVK